jgi:hypothetical protein
MKENTWCKIKKFLLSEHAFILTKNLSTNVFIIVLKPEKSLPWKASIITMKSLNFRVDHKCLFRGF